MFHVLDIGEPLSASSLFGALNTKLDKVPVQGVILPKAEQRWGGMKEAYAAVISAVPVLRMHML